MEAIGAILAARMSRYGIWRFSWGENISYGKTSARDIVLELSSTTDFRRENIARTFSIPISMYAGAAYGPHCALWQRLQYRFRRRIYASAEKRSHRISSVSSGVSTRRLPELAAETAATTPRPKCRLVISIWRA